MDLRIGAAIVARRARHAPSGDATPARSSRLPADLDRDQRRSATSSTRSSRRIRTARCETTLEQPLAVIVDPERARFSAWYELFPRSTSPDPKRHGTFQDVIDRLRLRRRSWASTSSTCRPSIPSAASSAKGPNNQPSEQPADPGVPWAIGGATGGHTAVHPELGTWPTFERLVARGATTRHRGRARHRLPGLARPPVGQGAPRVVPRAARRHHPVRREPAQEIPGHLPVRFRERATGAGCGMRSTTSSASGSARA